MKNGTKSRLINSILLSIIGFSVLLLVGNGIRTNYAINKQEAFSVAKLNTAIEKINEAYSDFEEDWQTYDDFIRSKVNMISYLVNKGHLNDLETISKNWGLDVVYVLDDYGGVITSYGSNYVNLYDAGLDRFIDYINGNDEHTYKTLDGVCYYISKYDNGYIVGGKKSEEIIKLQDEKLDFKNILENITVGENGFIYVVDSETTKTVYSIYEEDIGEYHFINDDNSNGIINTTRGRFYSQREDITIDGKTYWLYALVPYSELLSSTNLAIYISLAIYTIAVTLIIVYSFLLKDDLLNSDTASSIKYKHLRDDKYLNNTMFKKLLSIAFVGVILIFVSSLYFIELASVSRQKNLSNIKLDDVQTLLNEDDNRSEYLTNLFNEEYIGRANNIAWTLNYDKSLLNDEDINNIADILKLPELNVYDESGTIIYTNTNYKGKMLSEDNEFIDVLKGYKEYVISTNTIDDINEYIGVNRKDTKGMIEIALSNEQLNRQLENTGLVHVLKTMSNENNVWLISVNNETGLIEYCPNTRKIGLTYTEYGLDENCLKDEYVGWKNIDGKNVFLVSMIHGSSIIYNSVLNSQIVSGSLSLCLITTIISTILLAIVMFVSCVTDKVEIQESIKRSKKKKERKAYYTIVNEDGSLLDKEALEARWSNSHIDFDDLDAGQKIKRIVYCLCVVIFIGVFIYYISGSVKDESLLAFIESEKWEFNINLFSIAYVLITTIEIIVLATIIKELIVLLTKPFNARVNTFGRLLESFVKYGAAILIIIKALHSFGVDTATLIAGAGILTLVVGLGANSLIEDILAGIFIVFEGDYRVGDVVTIDDWRGIVEEIGIRTTKLVGFDKNVKIIRNSAIDSVINMTSQYSLASVDINVASYENLEEVEKIIEARFDHMRKEIPQIIDNIWIEGVIAYDQGSCTIRVTAPCYEEDRDDVLNRFYREFKLIYDENPDVFKHSDYSSINIVK